MPGASFNKFFPKPEGDFDVVFTQEKAGFAQAKLVKKGQDVATLSIFDTVSNPEAAEKYKDTQETFEDYPIIEIGNNGTGLLVGRPLPGPGPVRRTRTSRSSTARTG